MSDIFIVITVVIVSMFVLTALRGAPYVPSRSGDLERAFDELYELGTDDLLVDIGSGDGRVLMLAANRGAKAVGYEINPILVLISIWRLRKYDKVRTKLADFWLAKLPHETTMVYTFGDGRDIERMARKVANEAKRLEKTIYFMSYGFKLKSATPYKYNKMHFLYKFEALQSI